MDLSEGKPAMKEEASTNQLLPPPLPLPLQQEQQEQEEEAISNETDLSEAKKVKTVETTENLGAKQEEKENVKVPVVNNQNEGVNDKDMVEVDLEKNGQGVAPMEVMDAPDDKPYKKTKWSWFPSKSHLPADAPFGWLVVLASFLIHVVCFGVMYTFGVYFTEYVKLFPDTPSSVISFVGTLCPGLFPIFGIFTGRLSEKYGARNVVSVGGTVFVLALVLASFSTELWHLYLTQGALLGIGCACCYFPAVAIVPSWFHKHRGIATGLAVAGSGIGGLIIGPVAQALISSLGWRWSLRITAIFSAVILLIAWSLLFSRLVSQKKGPLFYFELFKDPGFVVLFIGNFVATFGFLLPYFYIPIYAETVLNLSPAQGAILVGILNGGSGLGRFLLGFASDHLGRLNLLMLCMFVGSLSTFFWPFTSDFGTLATYCVFFGFFAGGFISLTPVVAADFWGTERLSGVMGLLLSSTSLGNLFGVAIGGKIYEHADMNLFPAIMYAATVMMFTFFCYLVVKQIKQPINFKQGCFKKAETEK